MSSETVRPSEHARLRWIMRSGCLEASLRDAWDRATAVAPPEGVSGDEIRWHPETDTLLVAKDDEIATVLRGDLVDEGELEVVEAA